MQIKVTINVFMEDVARVCNIPVQGAIVSVQGSEDAEISDVNGIAAFVLPPGVYTFFAQYNGQSGSTVIDTTIDYSGSICIK